MDLQQTGRQGNKKKGRKINYYVATIEEQSAKKRPKPIDDIKIENDENDKNLTNKPTAGSSGIHIGDQRHRSIGSNEEMKPIALLLTSEKDKMRQELEVEVNAWRTSLTTSCKRFEKYISTFDKKYAALKKIEAGGNMVFQGLAMIKTSMEDDVVTIDDNTTTMDIRDEYDIIVHRKCTSTHNEEIEVNADKTMVKDGKPNNSAPLQIHEPTAE